MRVAALRAVAIFLICLLPLGAGLFFYGSSLPPYVDAAAAERLFMSADSGSAECAGEGWYRGMDALRTLRYPLMNTGAALALFSLSALAVLLAARERWTARLSDLITPSRTAWFFVLGVAATLAFIWAISRSFEIELRREYYPWCADSIAIPIFGAWAGGMIMLVTFLVAGAVVSLFFGRLPAPLTLWDASRPLRSWLWTIAAGLVVLMILTTIALSAPTATFWTIPSCVVGLYLTLATRAAALSSRD